MARGDLPKQDVSRSSCLPAISQELSHAQYRSGRKFLQLVKILVFRYLMTHSIPGKECFSRGARRIYFDHMVTPEVRALPVDEYDKHMDRYMLDILDMDFERGLEASDDPMVEMFDNDDLILYIWNTHVFHKMVTTNGAERFYTQLISLIFDFTTVEVEINCDSLGYDISMYLIHSDPQTAYKLLHSGMRIARVCNLPEDATDLDSRTMFAFSLYDTEKNRGHAMFITRGPCETKWTAPLH